MTAEIVQQPTSKYHVPHADSAAQLSFDLSYNPQLLVGHLVGGRFRITQFISVGGMGIVYEAEQLTTGQVVALKVIHPTIITKNDSHTERFALEIQLLAKLNHPHIISLIDSGLTSLNGGEMCWPFLVTEFIPGVSLTSYMKDNQVPLDIALQIWSQVAGALGYAHEKQVFHRDVKSDNVMVIVEPNHHIHSILIDFGVAKNAELLLEITKPGLIAGTLSGIAPEILRGEEATAQSDLFSLGVMIFQMLTKHLPCEMGNPIKRLEFYESTFSEDLRMRLPEQLPHGLIDLVLQLLMYEPMARPHSAYSVQRELDVILKELTKDEANLPLSFFQRLHDDYCASCDSNHHNPSVKESDKICFSISYDSSLIDMHQVAKELQSAKEHIVERKESLRRSIEQMQEDSSFPMSVRVDSAVVDNKTRTFEEELEQKNKVILLLSVLLVFILFTFITFVTKVHA